MVPSGRCLSSGAHNPRAAALARVVTTRARPARTVLGHFGYVNRFVTQ